MPMPQQLNLDTPAEVHIKSCYRRGGPLFGLKVATSHPHGAMLLFSASTGTPVALLQDEGHLTDVRTAAVAAMIARELGRRDRVLGIMGTGIQARLQARFHRAVLPVNRVLLWGRDPEKAQACAREIDAEYVESRHALADRASLIVTCTASRAPLLTNSDLRAGMMISAVGSDAPAKHELHPAVLRQADLLLVDSLAQCRRLGELQHTPDLVDQAIEMGHFCLDPQPVSSAAFIVADFTGLGVEDLFIAESVLRVAERNRGNSDARAGR